MEITATLESEIWQSENSSDCRVITEVAPPYRVVHANLPWCHTTGWAQSEICNNTCQVLQGPDTSTRSGNSGNCWKKIIRVSFPYFWKPASSHCK